ncbi:MAG: B12-binding domain-containing radical SAM protein [Promethearchaeota archaeon]
MIDVCLINPRTSKERKDNKSRQQKNYLREPPTGLLILTAILEMRGFTVEIVDCSILEDTFNYIRENAEKYRLFGVTSLTNTFYRAIQIAKTAKRFNPNVYIVMGGPHVSFTYEEVLKEFPFIDFICVGESEHSFPWLVKKLLIAPSIDLMYEENLDFIFEKGNIPGKIQKIMEETQSIPKGIVFLSKPIIDPFIRSLREYNFEWKSKPEMFWTVEPETNSKIFYSGFPDPTELSKIPLPSRHQLSLNYTVADIIVNRGCSNRCSFCSRTKLFPKLRVRPLDNIMKELEQILSFSNYNFVNFYDNINIDRSFFEHFLRKLIEKEFPLPWGAELRADIITEEQAKLMKKANCKIVATGVESADENVLKTNYKFQDPEKVAKGINILKKEGIAVQAYFVIGLPGETNESFEKTIRYIKKLSLKKGVDKLELFAATPYPGSDLAINPDKYGLKVIINNYNLYNCQEPIMEIPSLRYKQIKEMNSKAKDLKKNLSL